MTAILMGLLAETFVHPGTGQSVGAIDLPVAREWATNYPFIAGSSFKGALKDAYRTARGVNDDDKDLQAIFGVQQTAGDLLVSDVRLLLLPVRSLTGAYRWVTCPLVLERLRRDGERSGQSETFKRPEVAEGSFLGKEGTAGRGLFLEERHFPYAGPVPDDLIEALGRLFGPAHADAKMRLESQLVVLSSNDFQWFANNALSIQARNQLNPNKTSNNLWYEETLPPDTMMYCLLADRKASGTAVTGLLAAVGERPYVQAGGNETVGHGWFAIHATGGA